jgi:hypothetical protein
MDLDRSCDLLFDYTLRTVALGASILGLVAEPGRLCCPAPASLR